jgi:hypothetical protein
MVFLFADPDRCRLSACVVRFSSDVTTVLAADRLSPRPAAVDLGNLARPPAPGLLPRDGRDTGVLETPVAELRRDGGDGTEVALLGRNLQGQGERVIHGVRRIVRNCLSAIGRGFRPRRRGRWLFAMSCENALVSVDGLVGRITKPLLYH